MNASLEKAREIEPELVEIRRDFHRHPEIGFQEIRTGGKVAEFCERLGLKVLRGAAKTGVIAELNPEKSGPVLGLRADMDALPIHEENDVPYRSTLDGKGHMCGHDAHTAMLMGAAKLMTGCKDRIPFRVRFFFQPAEEVPDGGAVKLIDEGHLMGVDEMYGLHVNPQLPTGTLGLKDGPTMASMDRFELLVEGVGGHGAMPSHARDPIVTAAEIVMALQTIVARRVDPLEPAVVTVGKIEAGNAFNVIPPRCTLVGTARSLSREVWEPLPGWVESIAQGIARAHGLDAKLEYQRGTPVLNNTKGSTDKLGASFRRLGGKEQRIKATMGGEDFAYYLEKVPGCFGFLGAGDGTPSTAQCFHHPKYNIDEKALAWGSALFVQLVLDRAGS
ncbi:MAG: amidohydrolase [Planctomycetota bacterium]|nr:amidohydrolase [Planctomycetota bacterium]